MKPEKGIGLLIGIGGSGSHEGEESETSDKELAFNTTASRAALTLLHGRPTTTFAVAQRASR